MAQKYEPVYFTRKVRYPDSMYFIAWTLFFAGLAGVLWDANVGLPPALASSAYVLSVVGAGLFALSSVRRLGSPPAFLKEADDPWSKEVTEPDHFD